MREYVLVVVMVGVVIEAQWEGGRREGRREGRKEGRRGIKRFDRAAWPVQVGEIQLSSTCSWV